MTFWNWRRGPGPSATQGNVAMAASGEIAPIELYTADSRIVGWIAPNGQRVTDLLSTQDELRLWRPSPGALDERSLPPTERRDRWIELSTRCRGGPAVAFLEQAIAVTTLPADQTELLARASHSAMIGSRRPSTGSAGASSSSGLPSSSGSRSAPRPRPTAPSWRRSRT